MKRKILTLMVPVFIGIIFTSCSPILQRAYLATSPNLNHFTREKEKNVKASLFLNHYEIQSNCALSRHLGVSAGINGGFNQQFGGEVAAIFYENFTDKFYFEIQGGYGCFNNKSVINSISWSFGSIGEYGTFFSQHIDTRYQKIFIQPEWVYHTEKIDLAFACKIGANYFDRYHYDYCIEDNPNDYNYYHTISSSDFRYKWNFSLEPAVKIQFHSKLFLQASFLYSTSVKNVPVIRCHYVDGELDEWEYDGEEHNPSHLSFLFTIGYELKFGKKKEKVAL